MTTPDAGEDVRRLNHSAIAGENESSHGVQDVMFEVLFGNNYRFIDSCKRHVECLPQ